MLKHILVVFLAGFVSWSLFFYSKVGMFWDGGLRCRRSWQDLTESSIVVREHRRRVMATNKDTLGSIGT